MRIRRHLAAVWVAAAGITAVGVAAPQDHAHEHAGAEGAAGHGHGMCPEMPSPVLSVGDFNGDTIVDGVDVKELAERIARRDNLAFFDINADREVDTRDLLQVARQIGARSTPLDQELAAVFRATERYRDIRNAIEDGFAPATQSAIGHGVHWGRFALLDDRLELTQPEGLNYSEDGELLAVFYAVQPGGPRPDQPPEGFTGEEGWHYHVGACFNGVNTEDPSYDWRTLSFEECVPRAECEAEGWYEKFYMLHVWLYDLNRCGVFGGINPRITTGIDPDSVATRCPGGHSPHAEPAPSGPGIDSSAGAPHAH